MFYSAFAVLPVTLAVLALAVPASAQVPDAPPAASAPTPKKPTFAEYVRSLAKRRGDNVLLATFPPAIAAMPFGDGAVHTAGPPDDIPQDLASFEEAARMTIRRFGSLSVLTGKTMDVYVDHPDAPTQSEGDWRGNRSGAAETLAGTLTKDQWGIIASPAGFTYADCSSDKQRALWEQCIPDPVVVERTDTHYLGRQTPDDKKRTLTSAERYQIGLRVKLIGGLYAGMRNSSISFPVIYKKNSYLGKQEFIDLAPEQPKAVSADDSKAGERHFGTLLVAQNSEQDKPADIDYDALIAPVSLADPADGKALTVGVLVSRIEEATGLELYAHPGAENFEITAAGNDLATRRFPAGELLKALTCALQGTVRRLPDSPQDSSPLYVLSRDRDPLAVEQARLEIWERAARRNERESKLDLWKRVAEKNPLSLLRFDADDPAPMTSAQLQVYAESLRSGMPADTRFGIPTTVDEISPAARKMAQDQANQMAQLSSTAEAQSQQIDLHVSLGKLSVQCSVYMGLVIPGSGPLSGEIDDGYLTDVASLLPVRPPARAVLPGSLKDRILLLRADGEDDARSAVAIAVTTGASALWLEGAPKSLIAAVGAAQGKLPIYVACPLLAAANAPANLPRDRNVYGGESKDWLLPDDPAVIEWAKERLRQTAAIPGIAGILLEDIAAPGYRGPYTFDLQTGLASGDRHRDYERPDPMAEEWGYTTEHRRSFVRQRNVDPGDLLFEGVADVGEMNGGSQGDKPFARNDALTNQWCVWRQKLCESLLQSLRPEARGVELLLAGETTFPIFSAGTAGETDDDVARWFTPWPAAEANLPSLSLGMRRTAFPLPATAGTALAIFGPHTLTPAKEIMELAHRTNDARSTVIDLTNLSTKDAIQVLTAANVPEKTETH